MLRKTTLLALAFCALAAAPASAAPVTVTDVAAAPADKQAGAHSDFTLSFKLGGDSSVRDLDIDLPPGLIGNPNIVGRCSEEQFRADACPADSKVGTQTVTATVLLAPTDIDGDVYSLVPHAGEPGRLGIVLHAPTGNQFLESAVRVRSESDYGLTSSIRDIPDNAMGVPLHIDKISLTLLGKFMTNPTSCSVATTRVHAVGHDDSQGAGEGSFTPTACEALKYEPKLTATVGAEGLTGVNSRPPLSTVIEQGPDEAASKSAMVVVPKPLTPNTAALANVCNTGDYNADKCPDTSIVGQAQAISPLLPTPLAGPVRFVENPTGGLPRLVVYLNGLINIRLTADVGLSATGTATTFPSLPDVPLSRFQLDFNSGPNGLLASTADLCSSDFAIAGQLTAQSGKQVSVSAKPTVNGCSGVKPPTGGGGAKRPVASIALRRLAGRRPLLAAHVKRRSGGKKLRSVTLTLPRGLSLDRKRLRRGARVTKGVKATAKGRHTLVLRARSAKPRIDALVTGGALRARKSLRGKRVTVKVVIVDSAGKRTTLRKRVRAR